MINLGKCSLCLKQAHLQDSHYLPKGIYKALRDNLKKNPNPYCITKKSAIQTSDQVKAYLLCSNCEHKLNVNGENWVLRNCLPRNGESLLIQKIIDLPADHDEKSGRIYFSSNYPEIIDISALTYFAISIFWRGSIYHWNDNKDIPIKLGPYKEAFRQYLMQEKPFPLNTTLLIILIQKSEISDLTYLPVGSKKNGFHSFHFTMPGLAFFLCVGGNIPKFQKDYCFVNGKENPIFVPTQFDEFIKKEIREIIVKHVNKGGPRRLG